MTATAPVPPRLSVVVVSLGNAAALHGVLSALARQEAAGPFDVIIPANDRVSRLLDALPAGPGTARIVTAGASADHWLLRATGVRAAESSVIATLEDVAIPAPRWASAVLSAHAAPHAAIGGPVALGAVGTGTSRAMYFLDYGRYAPPVPAGPSEYLSACNVSYKRDALHRIADVWTHEMHETDVHWALQRAGETLWMDPDMVVTFHRLLALGDACRELRTHGRKFARGRRHLVPVVMRAARAVTTPLLPFVMLARSAAPVRRSPALLGTWLSAVVAMGPMAGSWALGELEGYLGRRDTVPGTAG